jgi:hypothetical protein
MSCPVLRIHIQAASDNYFTFCFFISHDCSILFLGLLSLQPLFLPAQEKKMGDRIEQETSRWKKGGKEGEEEVTAVQKEARAPPSTVPTVHTVLSSSSDTVGRSHTQTVLDQLSDSTFDFGVVAVYSCPNSCSSFSRTDTANHHHSHSHRDSHSHSKDEKSSNSDSNGNSKSNSSSENVSSATTPSHHSTSSASASAGRVCYEYIVVQPPADF